MKLSRIVVAGVVASAAVAATVGLGAQSAPKLTKAQRSTLEAVVTAVDRAAAASSPTIAAEWESHLLRASDGSHYVALTATSATPASPQPVVLYVRLVSRQPAGSGTPERSAVLEWLKGMRTDPLPMRASGSMSVPQGEMPVGGPSLMGRDNAGESVAALRLLTLKREREQRAREDREAKRRSDMERTGTVASVLLPFEDFDLSATLARAPNGDLLVRRSLTAGPGDYDVFVGWAEPSSGDQPPAVRVLAHHLRLPPAVASEFALSDVVLADKVDMLAAPYPADKQSAHPYAVGALEASPARGRRFTVDGTIGVLVQVINAGASDTGKPDVELSYRVSRVRPAGGEDFFATLKPQRYHEGNLPVDFDVAKGHPLFAAIQAPLATFTRGTYRVAVTAVDRLGGRTATADATFSVAGTPESLLREAPAPGQAFRREMAVSPAALAAIAKALTPPAPSSLLTEALAAAATGRFATLVQDLPVEVAERPIAQALRGLGLYGLGDSPRTVGAQLQQAIALGAPAPPVLLLLGATYALSGDDKGAIVAWNQARESGVDDASVGALLVDAYMRQGDLARATAMARAALDAKPGDPSAARGLAATRLVARQYGEALSLLDAHPAPAEDLDAAFLVVHALYASFIGQVAPGNTAEGRTRLQTVGLRYVDAGGRHAALVKEWLTVVGTGPSAK